MPSSAWKKDVCRSEEHTSELQSLTNLVCRLLLEKNAERAGSCQQHLELSFCAESSLRSADCCVAYCEGRLAGNVSLVHVAWTRRCRHCICWNTKTAAHTRAKGLCRWRALHELVRRTFLSKQLADLFWLLDLQHRFLGFSGLDAKLPRNQPKPRPEIPRNCRLNPIPVRRRWPHYFWMAREPRILPIPSHPSCPHLSVCRCISVHHI